MNAAVIVEKCERWIICIPGYLQRRGSAAAAIPDLHAQLRTRHSSPTCWVELLPWKSDWKSIAQWIAQTSVEKPRIDVFAYSWGVGYGLIRLARELRKHGLEIHTAVLSDGVAHVGPHPIARFLAFLPFWTIRIAKNVGRVWSFRQTNSLLRGHHIQRAEPPGAYITIALDPDRVHRTMDESPHFVGICQAVAAEGGSR
ncbi:MAG: hypothetical protein GY838_03750 [bacterium]|nr:hypothetical protein [bacterium]